MFIGLDLYDVKFKYFVYILKFVLLMKYEGINILVVIYEMEVKMLIGKVLELVNLL